VARAKPAISSLVQFSAWLLEKEKNCAADVMVLLPVRTVVADACFRQCVNISPVADVMILVRCEAGRDTCFL